MTGCLVFLRRTFQIPGTQNSQRQSRKMAHFFTIVRIRETTEWLFPATQPWNLDDNCHGFWRRNSRKHVAAFHHDPNLFIIIPLQADSTSKKKEKKKGKKKITSCILWFRCATFLIYASTKAPTRKNIQCGWSGILEVGLSDGAPAGSHNLTSCKPHVAKHVSKWPDRSNVSHVLSSWEPRKKKRRKLTHPASKSCPEVKLLECSSHALCFSNTRHPNTPFCALSLSPLCPESCAGLVWRGQRLQAFV